MTILAQAQLDTPFVIAEREFQSRLMVGTGKYASNEIMVRAIEASGAEVVTVAVRRVDLDRVARLEEDARKCVPIAEDLAIALDDDEP